MRRASLAFLLEAAERNPCDANRRLMPIVGISEHLGAALFALLSGVVPGSRTSDASAALFRDGATPIKGCGGFSVL